MSQCRTIAKRLTMKSRHSRSYARGLFAILITRPKHQAEQLATLIRQHGGHPICFPTIEIVGSHDQSYLNRLLKNRNHYNVLIFISPNAVLHSADAIHKHWPVWPTQTKVIAIGPGTRASLQHHRLPIDDSPEKIFNSESLLQLPCLQQLNQKHVLIIKGQGGNLTLYHTLKQRGAHVTRVNVYTRQLPPFNTPIPTARLIDAILCTSNTGLKNLLHLVLPLWGKHVFDKQLVLISRRTADYAQELGFVKAPLIADNASNKAILQTLFTWREHVNGRITSA